MNIRGGLLGLVLLAGCTPSGDPAPEAFTLDPNGIQPAGTDLRIDFGRAQTGVIETVSRLQGGSPAEVTTNAQCGAGEVTAARWSDGLTLNFLAGSFYGWVLDQNGIVTSAGLEVGQSFERPRFEETSLGLEFEQGGIFGLMDEQGEDIALLWSGVTCFFR